MTERKLIMRRVYGFSAMLLGIVLAGFLLGGCLFGSDEEPTTVTSAASASTTAPSSETSTTLPGQTTTTDPYELVDGLPKAFYESFGQRPIVVLFYVPGGVDDEKVLKSVRESESTYTNYTFLVYDYSVPAAYGDLSKDLSIGYPPQTVLIDRHGTVQTVWSGFVDMGTLNQTLLNLGKY